VGYDAVLIGILLPTFRRNLPVTRNLFFLDFPYDGSSNVLRNVPNNSPFNTVLFPGVCNIHLTFDLNCYALFYLFIYFCVCAKYFGDTVDFHS
jgi:hypothetical protein